MKNNSILAILVSILLIVNAVALVGYAVKPAEVKEVMVTNTVENSYNDSAIMEDLALIKEDLLKDSNWKSDAIVLATDEMEEKDYRNVYNALVALNYSIVEKEDISNVVIRDSEVTAFDVDEKDATVVQELKVYFEDLVGNDVKLYLTLTTEIKDNEVDDTVYELA